MNVKELVDTVTVVTPLEIRGSGVLTEWVSKSDFDRVVEELTKPQTYDIDCAGNAMIRVVVSSGGISVTNAMNGGGFVIPINEIIIITNT